MQYVPDVVEQNGLTIRENNMNRVHGIPVGALVEIDCKECDEHQLRLFVVQHARDCDGTPLYSLSANKNIMQDINDCVPVFNSAYIAGMKRAIIHGFIEENLNIIGGDK